MFATTTTTSTTRVREFPTQEQTLQIIKNSMKPIYIICNMVGLNASQFENNNLLQYCYLFFYLAIYTNLTIYALYCIVSQEQNFVVTNKYIVFAESCVMTTLMIIAVIFTFRSRKIQTKALELLSRIDLTFLKNGYQLNYHDLLKKNYVILIVASVSLLIRSVLIFMVTRINFIQETSIVMSTLIKAISKYQFVIFVLQLETRFGEINKILKGLFDERRNELVLDPRVGVISEKLYVLCRLHYKLASALQKINVAFAVQLLVSITVSLFDVLYQSYYLYHVASGKTQFLTVAMVICPIFWLTDEIVEIYFLVTSCANTCDQANETPVILHELRNKFFDLELENHIQTYSLQMLHQKVEFSVLGFFVVDYTLIYSIVGAVATYLVIFIQFDQSSSTQLRNDTIILE